MRVVWMSEDRQYTLYGVWGTWLHGADWIVEQVAERLEEVKYLTEGPRVTFDVEDWNVLDPYEKDTLYQEWQLTKASMDSQEIYDLRVEAKVLRNILEIHRLAEVFAVDKDRQGEFV